ncbi:hypothetical protein [Lentibacillus cibarius]|uniref:Uncharacterized protein n=1 Tax=Lentibacillus cibarius TaxID=2583219 RepID=A0A5S3QGM5_9BACI|nr:hypothetical protein [Lentibacillus cibarius]TMN20998.1 hypothetical protein FFL34_01915 [Lentibacillus cibarius]
MEIILGILAIIGAVAGFFKDKDETGTSLPKRQDSSETVPEYTDSGDRSKDAEKQEQSTVSTASIEELQDEQRKQLAERMDQDSTVNDEQPQKHEHDAITNHQTGEKRNNATIKQQKLKKQMVNNLNRTGLANGVIMSEVLGQPRARKPYQSVIAQRKK